MTCNTMLQPRHCHTHISIHYIKVCGITRYSTRYNSLFLCIFTVRTWRNHSDKHSSILSTPTWYNAWYGVSELEIGRVCRVKPLSKPHYRSTWNTVQCAVCREQQCDISKCKLLLDRLWYGIATDHLHVS